MKLSIRFCSTLGVEFGLFLVGPLGFIDELGRESLRVSAIEIGPGSLPNRFRDILVLQQLILSLQNRYQLIEEGALRVDSFRAASA